MSVVIVTDDPLLVAKLQSAGVPCSVVVSPGDRLPRAGDVVVVDTRSALLARAAYETGGAVCVAVIGDAEQAPEWADDAWTLRLAIDEIAARWRLAARLAVLRKENQRLAAELKRIATTDSQTGLLNRNGLLEILEHDWARSRRSGRPLACVMFDLDRFKLVNDLHGHLAGDAAIIAAANAIRNSGRECDVAARYGGDEFCVLLPECDLAGAELRARRTADEIALIRLSDEGPPIREGPSICLSASFGAAVNSPDHRKAIDLIHAADLALLEAKKKTYHAGAQPRPVV